MRRSFCIAASFLVFFTLPVWAQHHGGGYHGISGGGGTQSHSMRSFSGGNPRYNFGSFDTNFHITQDFGRRPGYPVRSGRDEFKHRGFHERRSFYPYGAYLPYYGSYFDPYYSSDYQNRYDNSDDDARVNEERYNSPNAPYREDDNLERDFQTLNGKIDRLQADVDARNRPKEQQPATALVFRDRRVVEVRNYAIAGGTLWVLSEQQSKKIPLAELDLDATAKMNDDRGVDFQVPK